MNQPQPFRLRHLLRGAPVSIRTPRGLLALVLRLASAALLVLIGYIHLHLWQEGYREIQIDGPLFLADALAAFVFAGALLVWARPVVGVLAAGFAAATLGALLISLSAGLFGFQESIQASFVVESIVIESIVTVTLAAWTVLVAWGFCRARPAGRRGRSRSPRRRPAVPG
jgi:uncharacterized membrane protein YidH (DUF202 family)